jgi:hypothetical protein
MRRPYLLSLLTLVTLLYGPPEYAQAGGFRFGWDDSVRKIQDIHGTDFVLCHRVGTYFFIAGVYVTDCGYVLQDKNVRDKYAPLDPEQVREWQRKGMLPTPLPAYSLTFMDYLFGYSLWIFVLIVVSLTALEEVWRRKRGRGWKRSSSPDVLLFFATGRFQCLKESDEEESTGPFREEEYLANAAASMPWELQQQLRKAATRVRQGKVGEAVRLLEQLLPRLPDEEQRRKIRLAIENLWEKPKE